MATIKGDSTTVNEAGVKGTNTAKDGRGVYGESKEGTGVWGWSQELSGVVGDSVKQYGVLGTTKAEYHGGVTGINNNSSNKAGPGVYGTSKGTGVWGESKTWMGVYGHSKSTTGGAGVMGENETGAGVIGKSNSSAGVYGESVNGIALHGVSESYEAIHAQTKSPTTAAIAAYNINPDGTGAAIYCKKEGSMGYAGFFEGNVYINGNIEIANNLILGNVNIQSLLQRIQDLENQIAMLKGSADNQIENKNSPYISAQVQLNPRNTHTLIITGNGFSPNKKVDLKVIYRSDPRSSPDSPQNHELKADSLGFINYRHDVICGSDPNRNPSWEAFAIDSNSNKKSNRVHAEC